MAIPTLVGGMLDKGTTKQNKFEIAQKLENIGAHISFSVGGVMTEFRGKCLRKDLPLVLSILAEELRTPAFTEEEFAKLKKQLIGNLQRSMESTDFRAEQAFAAAVFPVGHPNYEPPTKEFISAVEAAKLEDVKKFHADYYGPAQATLVAVGDIDPATLKSEIAKSFEGWSGGKSYGEFSPAKLPNESKEQTIAMADKPNVTLLIGQTSGLRYRDPDALALKIGTAALGSGFTGQTDGDGARQGRSDLRHRRGHRRRRVRRWRMEDRSATSRRSYSKKAWPRPSANSTTGMRKGITAAELERVKSNIVGSFKVGLTTTDGLASALLNAVHRGYDVSWLDEFPKRVGALSLQEVNAAIKKHLRPGKMILIKAGSVPPPVNRS